MAVLAVVPILSCGGSGGDDSPDPVVPAPMVASLLLPANNELCTEGILVSDTHSLINFQWEPSQHTDSYTLYLKNLQTGTESSNSTTATEIELTLERGMPYSWYVVSKTEGSTETASSGTWRLYNAGPPNTNYAPFPPHDPQPKMGATVAPGQLELNWESLDLDGDTLSHTLYLDTVNPPSTNLGGTQEQSFTVQVDSDTVYYWQVVCKDSAGNVSESGIFEFRTNL